MIRLPSPLKSLIDAARHKQVDKNQILLYQGDPLIDALFLTEGIVKMYDIDEAGNEKVLHIFKPPALIPLAAFSGTETTIRWFYGSLTDCEVAAVPYGELNELFKKEPDTTEYLMQWYSREVHEILTRLNSLSKTIAKDKIVAALKYLATFHVHATRGRWFDVTFPVTHQLLADLTGVSRESATVCLHELGDDKLIKMSPLSKLQINREKLFKRY